MVTSVTRAAKENQSLQEKLKAECESLHHCAGSGGPCWIPEKRSQFQNLTNVLPKLLMFLEALCDLLKLVLNDGSVTAWGSSVNPTRDTWDIVEDMLGPRAQAQLRR